MRSIELLVTVAVAVGCASCMRFVELRELDDGGDAGSDGDAAGDAVADSDGGGCISTCGDGVIECREQCDDTNTLDGDGCDSSCRIEGLRGNGVLDLAYDEECDDGGSDNGDGCSDTCQLEPVGATCGDGSLDRLEACDDSNTANGDGCNPTCNLTTTVTTLATGLVGNALALDDGSLWIGICDPPSSPATCEIRRLDLDTCLHTGSCVPVTVAGGACGAPVDGTGTSAVLSCVGTMTTDGATLWFGNAQTIRAMDLSTYEVTTLAGSPGSCAALDGTGSSALFHDIRGLTYLSGSIYLLDGCEEVLREFDPITRTVVTIAGQRLPDPGVPQNPPYTCSSSFTCTTGTPTDGQGLNAVFGSPRYMATDHAGHLYITDTNGEGLRSYDLATGWVSTLVGGQNLRTPIHQDGTAGAVYLERPRGLTSDGTSLYWNEQDLNTLRQLVIGSLEASTLAGVRGCVGSRDGVGGDGSQSWSGACGDPLASLPLLTMPMGGLVNHFPSRSLLLLEGGRLRQIQ